MRTHAARDVKGWCGLALSLALVLALLSAAPAQAQLGDRIRINGYSNFEWEYQLSNHDTGRGDKNGSFDADLFDLVLNFQPTDRLRVAADLTWEHGPATEDGRGNVGAEYAFAEYRIKDALRLRAGKMFVPFGIYNEIHTAKPATLIINESFATNKPEKLGAPARFYARWGAGLEAVGQFHSGRVNGDYSLLLFNGESTAVNPFEEDDNGPKAVAGRVRLEPHPTLKLGASFYADRITVYDDAGEDTGGRITQTAFGASLEWTPGPFGVELEWVGGQIPAGGTERVTTNGFSAVISRHVGARLTPYVQVQYLDPDKHVSDDAAKVYGGGLNVRVDTGCFVKLEVARFAAGAANTRLGGKEYTQAAAAIAIGF
jgi:hypothetical protein